MFSFASVIFFLIGIAVGFVAAVAFFIYIVRQKISDYQQKVVETLNFLRDIYGDTQKLYTIVDRFKTLAELKPLLEEILNRVPTMQGQFGVVANSNPELVQTANVSGGLVVKTGRGLGMSTVPTTKGAPKKRGASKR